MNERLLRQTSDSVVHTYGARNVAQKALSVLQSTTVYHCLVCTTDNPHNEPLADYIARYGGATFIPVVIVPGINEVLYPNLEEKVGVLKPRVEYLQYLLGGAPRDGEHAQADHPGDVDLGGGGVAVAGGGGVLVRDLRS